MLETLLNWFTLAFNWLISVIQNWMLWWRVEIFAWFSSAATHLYNLLPATITDKLGQKPWLPAMTAIDWITPFVPVYELVAILVATYTTIGIVRLLRWIAALVPGFNLGG